MSRHDGSITEELAEARGEYSQDPPPGDTVVYNATLPPEETAYLVRFRKSSKGNMMLQGWMTDTRAEGQPAAPFQLVVFTSNGGNVPLDKWTWGISIDGSETMEYSNSRHASMQEAALAARKQLLAAGLVFGDESSAVIGIRERIKIAARRRDQH